MCPTFSTYQSGLVGATNARSFGNPQQCGELLDSLLIHSSDLCRPTMNWRHDAVVREIAAIFAECGYFVEREVQLFPTEGDRYRPADLLVPAFRGGDQMVIDVTIVSPMSKNAERVNHKTSARYAVHQAQKSKHTKYDKMLQKHNVSGDFVAFAGSTCASWGEEARDCISRIASLKAETHLVSYESALADIYHRLNTTLMARIGLVLDFGIKTISL